MPSEWPPTRSHADRHVMRCCPRGVDASIRRLRAPSPCALRMGARCHRAAAGVVRFRGRCLVPLPDMVVPTSSGVASVRGSFLLGRRLSCGIVAPHAHTTWDKSMRRLFVSWPSCVECCEVGCAGVDRWVQDSSGVAYWRAARRAWPSSMVVGSYCAPGAARVHALLLTSRAYYIIGNCAGAVCSSSFLTWQRGITSLARPSCNQHRYDNFQCLGPRHRVSASIVSVDVVYGRGQTFTKSR